MGVFTPPNAGALIYVCDWTLITKNTRVVQMGSKIMNAWNLLPSTYMLWYLALIFLQNIYDTCYKMVSLYNLAKTWIDF